MACSTTSAHAYRTAIIHSVANPSEVDHISDSYEYFPDGILVVQDGHVKAVGPATSLLSLCHAAKTPITCYSNALICPGFVDTHIHFPQLAIVASYGEKLLQWLDKYVFPAEKSFSDAAHATTVAHRFVAELLRNGTTTALVFCTIHTTSVDAFFEAAAALNLRMIAGKTLMDRGAPTYLTETPKEGYKQSKELIKKWHGCGRLSYAVTPRFAVACSGEQLCYAGKLLKENPGVYLHTHLSENEDEIKTVANLFPERSGYLDVYDHYGLVGPRSVFAHGVHLTKAEQVRLGQAGAAVAFCPTSNLFLGSGLLNLPELEKHGVNVGLGTDIGGGTSFSLLQTCNEAYKVGQLRGSPMKAMKALYLATLGGARALRLDDKIGSFKEGKEADFVVLDYGATPLLEYRVERCESIEEKLFVMMMLGDDRCVRETFAAGKSVYKRMDRL